MLNFVRSSPSSYLRDSVTYWYLAPSVLNVSSFTTAAGPESQLLCPSKRILFLWRSRTIAFAKCTVKHIGWSTKQQLVPPVWGKVDKCRQKRTWSQQYQTWLTVWVTYVGSNLLNNSRFFRLRHHGAAPAIFRCEIVRSWDLYDFAGNFSRIVGYVDLFRLFCNHVNGDHQLQSQRSSKSTLLLPPSLGLEELGVVPTATANIRIRTPFLQNVWILRIHWNILKTKKYPEFVNV